MKSLKQLSLGKVSMALATLAMVLGMNLATVSSASANYRGYGRGWGRSYGRHMRFRRHRRFFRRGRQNSGVSGEAGEADADEVAGNQIEHNKIIPLSGMIFYVRGLRLHHTQSRGRGGLAPPPTPAKNHQILQN